MNMRVTFCAITLAALGITVGWGVSQAQEPVSASAHEFDSARGKLLFTGVVRVEFSGPGHPANSDGSLGGIADEEYSGSIAIYENYICRESAERDGIILREYYAYDKLGKFVQRHGATVMGAELINPMPLSEPAASPAPIAPNSQTFPHQNVKVESLVNHVQNAKGENSEIILYTSQHRFIGKVLEINAEHDIVKLKNQDGLDLFVALSKIEALQIP